MLMPSANKSDTALLRRIPQGIKDVQIVDRDNAENGGDTLGDERFNDGLAAGHFCHGYAP